MQLGEVRNWLVKENEFWKGIYNDLPPWKWILWGIFFAVCIAGIVIGWCLSMA